MKLGDWQIYCGQMLKETMRQAQPQISTLNDMKVKLTLDYKILQLAP